MRVDIKILTQDSLLPTAVVIHTSLAHAGISSLAGAVPSLTAPGSSATPLQMERSASRLLVGRAGLGAACCTSLVLA